VTLGLKLAGVLSALCAIASGFPRCAAAADACSWAARPARLRRSGERGPDVENGTGGALQLRVADTPWHAHRDRLCELAARSAC
jgi:hypothetical protein